MSLAQILAFLAAHPLFATNHPVIMAHVDLDGDGYSGATDCDDRDPTTHPGAVDGPFDGLDQDCDGSLVCEYIVPQPDGSFLTMPNQLTLSLSSLSPSGPQAINPNGQEVIRFNLWVAHPDCPDVTWESAVLDFNTTDNAQTGWLAHDIKVHNLTDDGTTDPIWTGELNGPMSASITGDYLPAGTTKSIGVWANLSGAAPQDDVRVDIDGATLVWCSMGACSLLDTTVDGNTISF